jgi:flagellar biosynthetic protein FliR
MSSLEYFLVGRFIIFTLVLARIGGLIATSPLYTALSLPRQVKVFLAVALSLLIAPIYWNASFEVPAGLAQYGHLFANEVFVGILMGLGMAILFAGIQVAGQIVGQMSGMSLGEVFNPGFDDNVSVFSQLFYFLVVAVFVAIGGHRLVTEALLDTFAWAPPGHAMLGEAFVETLTDILTHSFVLGIRSAAPVLVALFLSTIVLGLVGRTLPQLNILLVGFGLNSALTMGMILLALGAIAWTFQEPMIDTLHRLQDTIH